MKKVIMVSAVIIGIITGSAIGVSAYETLNYTLEDGVLTVHETEGLEGELILPSGEMGAVDKIIVEETAGSSGVTAMILTAKDEIIIEKNTFFGNENIKELELKAGNKVTLCGEGWNWNDRWNFGCFEASGLEKVVISTKELDMSDGWAFHECRKLSAFEATAESYTVGEHCFTDYYWNGTRHIFWIPWVENQTEDFVYLGDTIIAYKGDADEVTIPNGKLSLDIFNANGYDYDIKKIIVSDEITKIPQTDLASVFSHLESLEAVKMPAGITEIPNFCFWTNTELKQVWIGKSVTKIGGMVFPENSNATIHYEGTKEEWEKIAVVSDGEISDYYQRYLNTLTNMSLHFDCVNADLKKNAIVAVNIIDDSPYRVEVRLEGEVNTGVIFVALFENGYLKEVTAEKTDGYYQLSKGREGDEIRVFWFDGRESLKPLCEMFEYK